LRVFVALPLPADVREKLDLWLGPIRSEHPGLRWVRIHQIHLTLRFLGEVGNRTVEEAARILEGYGSGPVRFRIDTAGTFPGRGGSPLPSVYWVGGQWDDAVRELAGSLAPLRDDRGSPGSTKRFRPHLTIARQGRYNEKVDMPDPGPWTGTMDRAVVYESRLTASGPEYSVLRSFGLQHVKRATERKWG
jgi:2'-5' RNA ligase